MTRRTIGLFILSLFAWMGLATAQGSDKEAAALAAAEEWLGMVDAERYGQSWNEASGYFRRAVMLDEWEQALQSVRAPLGGVLGRKVRRTVHATSLPGAPDGEYVVIQYEASFEHKKSAIETVTPMRDEDGRWRVGGYYIQ
ncbi:DUF4019 domain-containing protein [Desulfocurvibacter africanus]|uniref:DUF4019 domain-containing protein n=1 Tax=Desulfocurvibacter africanus TaxID=873 RepID=UPI0004193DE3|nr:DUF4019 domain-containing protein [Desulfocurvibacter africanus]